LVYWYISVLVKWEVGEDAIVLKVYKSIRGCKDNKGNKNNRGKKKFLNFIHPFTHPLIHPSPISFLPPPIFLFPVSKFNIIFAYIKQTLRINEL